MGEGPSHRWHGSKEPKKITWKGWGGRVEESIDRRLDLEIDETCGIQHTMSDGSVATYELRELKDRLCKLHGIKSNKDVLENKTKLFRRVVHLMVAGVDVSELFSAMVLAAAPDEPALKKLLYLYLCTYAKTHPDLALMTVNTLTVDCANEDPTIRRSALRSLCSIATQDLADYLVQPLQAGMRDRNALVRSVAVIGTWELHRIQPELVEQTGLLEQVQTILQEETDPQVLTNAMAVVRKLDESNGMHNQAFVYALHN
eukprot:scaffold2557_cov363-Pavlova_lutheri.AAC.3